MWKTFSKKRPRFLKTVAHMTTRVVLSFVRETVADVTRFDVSLTLQKNETNEPQKRIVYGRFPTNRPTRHRRRIRNLVVKYYSDVNVKIDEIDSVTSYRRNVLIRLFLLTLQYLSNIYIFRCVCSGSSFPILTIRCKCDWRFIVFGLA